jgi:hypothetical protein
MPGAFADRTALARIVAAVRALDSHALADRSVEEADTHIQLEAAAVAAMTRWAAPPCWGTLEELV